MVNISDVIKKFLATLVAKINKFHLLGHREIFLITKLVNNLQAANSYQEMELKSAYKLLNDEITQVIESKIPKNQIKEKAALVLIHKTIKGKVVGERLIQVLKETVLDRNALVRFSSVLALSSVIGKNKIKDKQTLEMLFSMIGASYQVFCYRISDLDLDSSLRNVLKIEKINNIFLPILIERLNKESTCFFAMVTLIKLKDEKENPIWMDIVYNNPLIIKKEPERILFEIQKLDKLQKYKAANLLIKLAENKDAFIVKEAISQLMEIDLQYLANNPKIIKGLIKAIKNEDTQTNAIVVIGNLLKAREEINAKETDFQRKILSKKERFLILNVIDEVDKWTKGKIAEELGKINSRKIVEFFIETLDNKENISEVMAYGLINVEDKELILFIIDKLIEKLNVANANVRYWAMKTLSVVADPNKNDIRSLLSFINYDKYDNHSAGVREIKEIKEITNLKLINKLIETLNDNDLKVKLEAIKALGNIGDRRFVKPLIETFNDKNPEVRIAVAKSLRYIADRRTIPTLIKALEDENLDVRSSVSYTLFEMAELGKLDDHWKYIFILAKALNTADETTFRDISNALETLLEEIPLSDLIKQLKNDDPKVRYYVVLRLTDLEEAKTVPNLIKMLKDSYFRVRSVAAIGLGKLKNPIAVQGLIKSLADNNAQVHINAVRALGKIADPQAIPALIKLIKDPDPEVRFCVADSLTKLVSLNKAPYLKSLTVLIKALKDNQASTRAKIAELLGKIADPRATQALIKSLKDPFAWVRAASAKALGEIADPKALSALLKASKDKEDFVREKVIFALGKLKDKSALPTIINALDNKQKEIRLAATLALGNLGQDEAAPFLIKALKDEETNVQKGAIDSLGKIPNPEAKKALEELINDETENPYLRQVARETLSKLVSKNF
ncbi:MAG: HEAT repeat domain-containing protein [Acidobacteria bacterium]|nr:HEAT repeat domain-containing protein [Acidobacteriota bacterium]